ncbi:MAG: indole-3-glycerol-phosphate synthase [bacterium]|nr:indole-3-glycerol-phosphate synthase [bacterium]
MNRLAGFFDAARERAATLPQSTVQTGRAAAAGPTAARPCRSLRAALAGRTSLAVIAEFKRRSPSAGPLGLAADPAAYARDAVRLGAAALSVLVEPRFFDGSYTDLAIARAVVDVPILAKDFIIDPRQIETAARYGADAVLLILRGLDDRQVDELGAAAAMHGLDVVLECHDAAEVERALAIDGAIVGVNNRDLDTLAVDVSRAAELLPRVPPTRIALAESGYRTDTELRTLHGVADGALIGTSLMRGGDLGALVAGGRG